MPTTTTPPSSQQNILQRLGLSELPEATQAELLSQMGESLLKRMTLEVLGEMSEEHQEAFLELQKDGPDPEAAEEFLKTHIPDFAAIQERVVSEFVNEMQGNVEMLRKGFDEDMAMIKKAA